MIPPIEVILVRTIYPSNIGTTVRAMANMGSERLILIDPQCDIINAKSRQGAAGAADYLQKVKSYATWDEFYANEPDGVRFAFTRRSGFQRRSYPLPEALTNLLEQHQQSFSKPIYLIFGPEDNGLDAEDMAWVHHAVSLPTYGEFKSLNLSQAVLLGLYIVRNFFDINKKYIAENTPQHQAAQPFYFPDQSVKEWLTAMGFDISARRSSAYLTLRRLFLQNYPTAHELQVLESILQQNIRKLKESLSESKT